MISMAYPLSLVLRESLRVRSPLYDVTWELRSSNRKALCALSKSTLSDNKLQMRDHLEDYDRVEAHG
jgi:hypothetical protein